MSSGPALLELVALCGQCAGSLSGEGPEETLAAASEDEVVGGQRAPCAPHGRLQHDPGSNPS